MPQFFQDVNNIAGQFRAGGRMPDADSSTQQNSQQVYNPPTQQSDSNNKDDFNPLWDIGGFLKGTAGFITGTDFRNRNEIRNADKSNQINGSNNRSSQSPNFRYSTEQTDQSRNNNVDFTGNQTFNALDALEQRRRDRLRSDLGLQIGYENLTADRSNAIANANTGRNLAVNSASTLNDVYRLAGERLNNAARDSQQSLNNAAVTVASLFR